MLPAIMSSLRSAHAVMNASCSGARAPVVRLVPFERADPREEVLHLLFVVEELAVEVARVPVDEHAPDVEDHGVSGHAWQSLRGGAP
jgi:hypothetical protein